MARRVLYLVRHAQYAALDAPPHEPDGSLTAAGQEQAALTAQRLRTLPISVIHHSNLRRSVETAAILAAHLPGVSLRPARLLRECIPCMPPLDSLAPAHKAFFEQLPREAIEQGGPLAQRAFEAYFKRARGADRHELLVSHGNLICSFVCRVLRAPPESWLNTDIQHCGLSIVEIEPSGRMTLVCHNDTGHLPDHLRTYT